MEEWGAGIKTAREAFGAAFTESLSLTDRVAEMSSLANLNAAAKQSAEQVQRFIQSSDGLLNDVRAPNHAV